MDSWESGALSVKPWMNGDPDKGCDCIDRMLSLSATGCGHKCMKSEHSITETLARVRAQGYRIKRISACGGCLGDYRR